MLRMCCRNKNVEGISDKDKEKSNRPLKSTPSFDMIMADLCWSFQCQFPIILNLSNIYLTTLNISYDLASTTLGAENSRNSLLSEKKNLNYQLLIL